jgi:hypothetical protein
MMQLHVLVASCSCKKLQSSLQLHPWIRMAKMQQLTGEIGGQKYDRHSIFLRRLQYSGQEISIFCERAHMMQLEKIVHSEIYRVCSRFHHRGLLDPFSRKMHWQPVCRCHF